jgi:hypothetical protein
MSETKKPDFVLSNGREVFINLAVCTHKQWRGIWDKAEADESTDTTLARIYGMSVEELESISEVEYRQLLPLLINRMNHPISDPNA